MLKVCFSLSFSLSLSFFVGSAPPVGPAFGTVNTSVSEDGAVITWDYFGHHKNVYVEYIVENSKALLCVCSHECMNRLAAYN